VISFCESESDFTDFFKIKFDLLVGEVTFSNSPEKLISPEFVKSLIAPTLSPKPFVSFLRKWI